MSKLSGRVALTCALMLACLAGIATPAQALPSDTTLISRASGFDGVKQNGFVDGPVVSADGRFVAFTSNAPNLGSQISVYVRDTETGTTELVSRETGESGAVANDASESPAISANGRYIAFESLASNLSPDDGSSSRDVYVRDTVDDVTTLVSRANGATGIKANNPATQPSLSADGQRIAFLSAADNLDATGPEIRDHVFVRDLETLTTSVVDRAAGANGPVANGPSAAPEISADGSFVAFEGGADNLVPGGTFSAQIYRRGIDDMTTIMVSRGDGQAGPAADGGLTFDPDISADGDRVVFTSNGSNLVPSDTDGTRDVFMREVSTESTSLISGTAAGVPGNGINDGKSSISGDGRFVAFESFSTNLDPEDSDGNLDVMLTDTLGDYRYILSRATGATGAKGNFSSRRPSISADGRAATFYSEATNLHPDDPATGAPEDAGDTDVYLREVDIAPEVRITSAPSRTADSTPPITYSVEDVDDDIIFAQCHLDEVEVACNIPSPDHTFVPTAPLSDGEHTFSVRVVDALGQSANTARMTFTVDTVGPAVSFGTKPPAQTTDSTPTVSFSSSAPDLDRFECAVDDTTFSPCTSPLTTAPLSPGAHTIDVRGRDDLGNVGATQRADFTVVREDPPVDPEVSDPKATLAKSIKITGKEIVVPVRSGAAEAVTNRVSGVIKLKPKKGKPKTTAVAAPNTGSAAGKTVALQLRYSGSKKHRQKATKKLVKGIQKGGEASIEVRFLFDDAAGNVAQLDRTAKLKAKKKRKK